MPDALTTNSPIIAAYRAATPGSGARAGQAAEMFPSGITHDARYIEPYGLYIPRPERPRQHPRVGRSGLAKPRLPAALTDALPPRCRRPGQFRP